jgi:uncharacterized protein
MNHEPPLYTASVPVLQRYLGSLAGWLDALAHGPADQVDAVLQARLVPEMMDFGQQVETAAYLALRTALPLAGRPVPPFGTQPRTLPGLRERVWITQTHLAQLVPQDFAQPPACIAEQAGQAALHLPPATFLHQFAMPNFLFHVTLAYALAREQGLPLGKADFDGFHRYERNL